MSYRKIRRTCYLGNINRSLVLRQLYAKIMLSLLAGGKRILNVDESTIPFQDYHHSKWHPKGRLNTCAFKDLTLKLSMIAGLDTKGNVYVAISQTNTDSSVISSFLHRLV